MNPVDAADHIVAPRRTVADFELSTLVDGHWSYYSSSWVLQDADGGTMELSVEEEVALVEVLLDQHLVLVGISTSDNEVVLGCDEPEELLEPEYLSVLVHILHHVDLVLLKVADGCLLSHLDCNFGCTLRLLLLLI